MVQWPQCWLSKHEDLLLNFQKPMSETKVCSGTQLRHWYWEVETGECLPAPQSRQKGSLVFSEQA